jgi:ParB-like chromosome segregation protein Spo0J
MPNPMRGMEGVKRSASSFSMPPGKIKPNLSNLRFESYGMPLAAVAKIWAEPRLSNPDKADLVRSKMTAAQVAWADIDVDWAAMVWLDSNEFLESLFVPELSEEDREFVLGSLGDPSDDRSMGWLVQSILTNGLTSAIEGLPIGRSGVIATDGNRRWTALRILALMGHQIGWVRVDASSSSLTSISIAKRQYLANRTNRPTPLEDKALFSQMAAAGLSDSDIARELGLNTPFVTARLKLGSITPAVRQMLTGTHESGITVAATTVQEIVRAVEQVEENPVKVAEIASAAIQSAAQQKSRAAPKGRSKRGCIVSRDEVQFELDRNLDFIEKSEDGKEKDPLIREISSLIERYGGGMPYRTLLRVRDMLSKALAV